MYYFSPIDYLLKFQDFFFLLFILLIFNKYLCYSIKCSYLCLPLSQKLFNVWGCFTYINILGENHSAVCNQFRKYFKIINFYWQALMFTKSLLCAKYNSSTGDSAVNKALYRTLIIKLDDI